MAAIGLFVTTLSFLITTPGVIEPSAGIAGALSSTGQFLIKDAALLGVAVWTLTDALRAQLLRIHGYRADVVEFVASQHTPRNTLLRAVRTGAAPRATDESDYLALVETWRVQPKLAELLA